VSGRLGIGGCTGTGLEVPDSGEHVGVACRTVAESDELVHGRAVTWRTFKGELAYTGIGKGAGTRWGWDGAGNRNPEWPKWCARALGMGFDMRERPVIEFRVVEVPCMGIGGAGRIGEGTTGIGERGTRWG